MIKKVSIFPSYWCYCIDTDMFCKKKKQIKIHKSVFVDIFVNMFYLKDIIVEFNKNFNTHMVIIFFSISFMMTQTTWKYDRVSLKYVYTLAYRIIFAKHNLFVAFYWFFLRLNNRSAYLSYVLCLYLERQIAIPIPDKIPITKLVKHNGPMLFLSETPIYMSDYGLIK